MKLVFFSSDNIGDAILANIILENLAKTVPEIDIVVYNKNHNITQALFAQNPNISSVNIISTKVFSRKFFRDIKALWGGITKNDGILVTSLLGSQTVMIGLLPLIFLQKLTGANRQACRTFGMKQKLNNAKRHIIDSTLRQLETQIGVNLNREIGVNFLHNFIGYTPKKQQNATQKAIAIIAGSSTFEKTLPAGKFAEIITHFAGQGFEIKLLGSKNAVDQHQASEIMRIIDGSVAVENLAGKTDLKGYFAEIASVDYVITNDSSGQHIANVLGTPCGVLWARNPQNPIVKAYAWQNELTANIFGKKYHQCKKCSILGKFFINKPHCKACIKENYSKMEASDVILQIEAHLSQLRLSQNIS